MNSSTPSTKKYCCSYCRQEGHNITKCHSPKIAELDKRGDDNGLFDIIILLFCNSSVVNRTIVYNERYNFTKKWLDKLTVQETKVLTFKHEFHKTNKGESIENQKKRLFYYYFDDKITNYSLEEYTEMLYDIKDFPKEKFNIYSKMYVDLIEEPELKRELKNELKRISYHLYQSNKFNIKITKISTPKNLKPLSKNQQIPKDCPICYETMTRPKTITTNCNHEYCDTCIKSYLECCGKEPTCPMCRERIVELKTPTKKTKQMLEKYCLRDETEEPTPNPTPNPHPEPTPNPHPPTHLLTHQQQNFNNHLVNIFHTIVGF